jgi:hypothetical protein
MLLVRSRGLSSAKSVVATHAGADRYHCAGQQSSQTKAFDYCFKGFIQGLELIYQTAF